MTALLSVAGCMAQDIQETLEFRQNLRRLIEAEVDNPADSDLTPSLDEHYVKTLQELNISSFKKNPYSTNTSVQHASSPQCDVGVSWTFQDLSQFIFKILITNFGRHNFNVSKVNDDK